MHWKSNLNANATARGNPRRGLRVAILASLLAMVLWGGDLRGLAEGSGESTRIQFKEVIVQRETEQAPDPPVSVFLELDRVQEQVGRGLRFAVVISNESDEPLVLTDVTEKLDDIAEHLVNIRLTDADGTRVELPSAGSIGRVNTKDPEGYRASWADRRTVYRVPEDPRARPAQTKTPDDVDDGTITLNPGESYRVAYAVTRVLRDAKQYRGRERELFESGRRPATGEMERPPTAPIAGGRYLLWLEVYLTGPLTTNPFLRCFKLEKGINGIEVQLGGP